MKQIGSLIGLFGIAAIIFGFMDRVPSLLQWIYKWGDGIAWAIKIGMVVVGGALYFMGRKNETT
jgi:hypothetical protein